MVSRAVVQNIRSHYDALGHARRFEGSLAGSSLQDLNVLQFDIDDFPEIEALALFGGDPCHYRVDLAKDFATGHSECCAIADGFMLFINDFELDVAVSMSGAAPDFLRLWISSDGECDYEAAPGEVLDVHGPGAWLIMEPAGGQPAEASAIGHHRSVQVFIHRQALSGLYARGVRGLPPLIQAFLAGGLDSTVARRLPLAPGLLRCLDDLHGCTLDDASRRLFLQSKAVEMLCHAFEALAQEESFGSAETSGLTMRGVVKARDLLAEQFVAPPSLDDLAQAVGLSRSGLCAGFRQIMGKTVFDYIADLRMQYALELLKQQGASISQVAYAVGYTHPSSFSIAVQRRFGTTPTALRRGHMAGQAA